jgi:hypothetical protein
MEEDNKLFRKPGNCIEGLPTEIFRIIQQFLWKRDYRSLNVSHFQSVKFATEEFTFRIKDYRDLDLEMAVQRTIRNVKNKSTQIKFSFSAYIEKEIIQIYLPLMKGSKALTITGSQYKAIDRSFPFSILSNTCNVQLNNIRGFIIVQLW